MRASDTSEVLFENCRVPADQLLGEEGQGFVNTMQVLDAGRIGIAALSVGLAQGAYEAALALRARAQGVRQADRQLPGDPVEAGRQRDAHRGGAPADLPRGVPEGPAAERTTLESSMAKLYASEIAVKAADDCVQIHGGYGFVKDYPAEKFFRDVKLTTIGEGTSEIQRLVIARQLLLADVTRRTLADARARGRPARHRPRDLARSRTRTPAGAELVRAIFGRTGRAYLVGVTGPPGAGKSTLVDRLDRRDSRTRAATTRRRHRRRSRRARSPAAPCSAIALRMQAHAADEGVFIRSMATRGHLGGLARATGDAALVLDAAGKDIVIIETVGVGQDEVDIVRTADVSIVTLVPGTGDDVQALKAGIMEIADIFVVNKADREGADRLVVGDRGEPVAADVRERRVAAADPEDGGDDRRRACRSWSTTIGQFRAHSQAARSAARRATRSEYRLRELRVAALHGPPRARVLAPGELGGDRRSHRRARARSVSRPPTSAASRARLGGSTRVRRERPWPCERHESRPRSRRHRGAGSARPRSRSIATRSASRSRRPRRSRRSTCARISSRSGESTLELLEATAPDSPIAKYVEKRGPGLHHITLRVDDIRAALAQLKARGVRLDRRAAAPGRRRRARRVHPPVERARRARRAEAVSSRRSTSRPSSSATLDGQRFALGDLELISLCDGFFHLDGGAMFGVVPKPLWEKKAPADERNRITLGDASARRARRADDDHRRGAGRQGEREVPRDLRRRPQRAISTTRWPRPAWRPTTSTSSSPSHLHFDHAGGFTIRDATAASRPRFPRAQYVVRRGEWEDATHPHERNRASYLRGQLRAARRGRRAAARRRRRRRSCRACACGGPAATRMHHQMVVHRVGRARPRSFVADLMPTTAHVAGPVDHGLRPVSDGHARGEEARSCRRRSSSEYAGLLRARSRRSRPATSASRTGSAWSRSLEPDAAP